MARYGSEEGGDGGRDVDSVSQNPLDNDFRRIVKEPEGRSAGFSVRHDPNAPAHKTEFTVEQLWPDGEAEPLYVGDRGDVLHLIQALSEVLRRAE